MPGAAFDRIASGASVPYYANMTATTDPGPTNDSSQGYQLGAIWFNTAAGFKRKWVCLDNTAGAAKWIFLGADYASGGTDPASEGTTFGGGTATIAQQGNIFRSVSSGVQCSGSNAAYVIGVYSIPGNSFDVIGRGVQVTAAGSFGGNTNSKRVQIIANPTAAVIGSIIQGGTVIADTGLVTTNGSGWSVQAEIYKYGIPGSNTQIGVMTAGQAGSTVAPLLATQLLTATESGAILVAVVGTCGTAANDIMLNLFAVDALD